MTEQWRDVPEYEGYYQVSDQGRVRSLDRYDGTRAHFKGRVLRQQEANRVGHTKVFLSRAGVIEQWLTHVLVWKAFMGQHDVINHKNGKAWDNRLVNLESGTHAENMAHARSIGLWKSRGEDNVQAKLSEADVRVIRLKRALGWKCRELAEVFHVCSATISNICNRQSWRHVA